MNPNSPQVDEGSLRYAGWGVLAGAFTGVMVSFAPIVPYTFSLFLDPLHAAFGWKREAMGGAFALAAITVALVSPLIGLLLDRFPPRRIILPAILAFALALASLSRLGSHIGQFYLTFLVLGLRPMEPRSSPTHARSSPGSRNIAALRWRCCSLAAASARS
jgi:MFS family permease